MAFNVGDALGSLRRPASSAALPQQGGGQPALPLPASVLRALRGTGPRRHRDEAVPIPVLVLLPVAASTSALGAQRPRQPAGASVGKLQAARTGTATWSAAFAASPSWSSGPFASPARPAFLPPGSLSPPSDADSAQRADSDTFIDTDTLPSFGTRTATAKQLLSAAPGGPVWGYSGKLQGAQSSVPNLTVTYTPQSEKKRFKKVFCAFCKKNGEGRETYTAHGLKEQFADGTTRVICPVLQRLRCEICGATGDQAHTRTHCPMGMMQDKVPVAALLKTSRRRCDGTKRTFFK